MAGEKVTFDSAFNVEAYADVLSHMLPRLISSRPTCLGKQSGSCAIICQKPLTETGLQGWTVSGSARVRIGG